MKIQAECCYIGPRSGKGCEKRAKWFLIQGYSPTDFTHACTQHVGYLLVDEPFNHIFPIESEVCLEE